MTGQDLRKKLRKVWTENFYGRTRKKNVNVQKKVPTMNLYDRESKTHY